MTFSKSFGSYSISLPKMRSKGPSSNSDGVKAPHVTPRTGTYRLMDRLNIRMFGTNVPMTVEKFNLLRSYLRGRQAIGFYVPLAVFKANGQVSRIRERDASAQQGSENSGKTGSTSQF